AARDTRPRSQLGYCSHTDQLRRLPRPIARAASRVRPPPLPPAHVARWPVRQRSVDGRSPLRSRGPWKALLQLVLSQRVIPAPNLPQRVEGRLRERAPHPSARSSFLRRYLSPSACPRAAPSATPAFHCESAVEAEAVPTALHVSGPQAEAATDRSVAHPCHGKRPRSATAAPQ